MQNDSIKKEVARLDKVGILDKKIKDLSFDIMKDGANAEWQQVKNALRELAYCCAQKGLTQADFLDIRKELILALEDYQPLAKTQIELAERHNVYH